MADIVKLKKKAADLEAKKQLDKALDVYRDIIEAYEAGDEDPIDIPLYNRVGDLLQKGGNLAEAVSVWEKAVDHYAEGGFYNPAIALCNKILRQSPGRTVIYYKLGKIHAEKGFKGDARQNFLEYASRQQKAGNLNDAFKALKEFAELVPDQHDVRMMLADQLVKAERKDEAIEQLQLGYAQAVADGLDDDAEKLAAKMKEIDPSVEPKADGAASGGGGGGLVFLDLDDAPKAKRATKADIKRVTKAVEGLELLTPETLEAPKAPPARPVTPAPAAAAVEQPTAVEPEVPLLEIEPTVNDEEIPKPRESVAGLEITSFGTEETEAAPATDLPQIDTVSADMEGAAAEAPDVPMLDVETTDLGGGATAAGDAPLIDLEPTALDEPEASDEPVEEPPTVPSAETLAAAEAAWAKEPAAEAAEETAEVSAEVEAEVDAEADAKPEDSGMSFIETESSIAEVDGVLLEVEPSVPEMTFFADSPQDDSGLELLEEGASVEPFSVEEPPAKPAEPAPAAAASEALIDLDDTGLDLELPSAPPPPTLEDLRDRVVAEPENWAVRRQFAETLLERGTREDAIAELEVAMAGYEQSGDLETAGSIAEEIVRLEPTSIRHHQKRVEFAFRDNDRSRLSEAYVELADALLADGQALKARAVYQRVLDINPDDIRAQAAIESIKVEEEPAPPVAPRRSTVNAPRRQSPEPTAAPKAPAAKSSDDDDDYVSLGDWLREDDEPKSTRMVVEEKEPTGDEQADFEDMLRKFKEGVSANVEDEDHEAHYDLGVAYKEMGLIDEAIAEFQKALRGTSARARTFEALGHCFVEKGQLPVAATILQRALAEKGVGDEALVGVLYLLGAIAEEQKQFADAKKYYERVFAVDIQFRDIGDRLNAVEQGL